MGWFDEQIRQRITGDDEQLSDSMLNMAEAVLGKSTAASGDRERKSKAAIDEILAYFHVKPRELPKNLDTLEDQLDYLLRPAGIMRRRIKLTPGWYRDCTGIILGMKKSGTLAALKPTILGSYSYMDYDSGERVKLSSHNEDELSPDALCFYRPLPQKALTIPDLIKFVFSGYSAADFITLGSMAMLATLISMIMPAINNLIFESVIPSRQPSLLAPLCALCMGALISTTLINISRETINSRISMRTNAQVEAAAMMRMLSLPANFFRKYSPGELMSRLSGLESLCNMLTDTIVTTGFTSIFSLLYIGQVAHYAPALVIPALIVLLANIAVSLATSFLRMNISERSMQLGAKENGLIFSLISGVQKIRLAGAEKRAFAKWANTYAERAKLQYDPPAFIKYSGAVTTAVTQLGIVFIYFTAVSSRVTSAEYMAFNAAYGLISGAFMSLASTVTSAATIRPVLNMVRPLLETVPEISENKKTVTSLSGSIELNNVTFRYTPEGPAILDGISLKIRSGEYIAIVGRTGCGKSTLIRLLLGFEAPQKGAVYYDGRDIQQLDLPSLRRRIGVVLQDGKLFPGDIYSNIVISAPWLTLDDAWKAAAMAGIDKDIADMPMGMHTLIGGESTGISGGQAQRLMIARAIAPRPRILIFDEATSALDNITQKQVTESLDSLKCTRIVVAHRLSTIKSCSRIIVLDGGHIVQDGSYDELMAQEGMFRDLVKRQQLDLNPAEK